MTTSMPARRPRSWPVLVSIAASTLVAWGAVLLAPNAKYWDDWVIGNDDKLRMTSELGIPWLGYIMTALFALGPWSFKVIVLLSTTAIGWLIYGISGQGLGLSRAERWTLAALVVALPLFEPRVLASLSTYSWSLALFLAGWYLWVRVPPASPGAGRYVVGTVLILLSYTTASLLPLTAFPVLHLAMLSLRGERFSARRAIRFVGRHWYVFATPVTFWVLRTLFLQPFGVYAGYNSVGAVTSGPIRKLLLVLAVAGVTAAVVFVYRALARRPRSAGVREALAAVCLGLVTIGLGVFVYLTRVSTDPLTLAVPALLAAAGAAVVVRALVVLLTRTGVEPQFSLDHDTSPVLAVGIALLVFGIAPYLLVGKVPTFQNWEMRHQVLMPLGVATIAVAGLRAASPLLRARPTAVLSVALVAVMTCLSLISSLGMLADSRKASQIIAALEKESLVRSASTVYFDDQSPWLNWDDRTYSFYEYTGWMQTAYGDQKRLGVDKSTIGPFLDNDMTIINTLGERYGVSEYVRSTDGVRVEIKSAADSFWPLVFGAPVIDLVVTPVADLDILR